MQDGIEDMELMYVGCLPVELDPDEQDVRVSFLEGRAIFVLPVQLSCKAHAFASHLLQISLSRSWGTQS